MPDEPEDLEQVLTPEQLAEIRAALAFKRRDPPAPASMPRLLATTLLYSAAIVAVVLLMVLATVAGVWVR